MENEKDIERLIQSSLARRQLLLSAGAARRPVSLLTSLSMSFKPGADGRIRVLLRDEPPAKVDVSEILRAIPGVDIVWPEQQSESDNEVRAVICFEHEARIKLKEQFPALQMISLGFTGYDEVDVEAFADRGVALYYLPDYSADSVAELTLALALASLRKIVECHAAVIDGQWDRKGELRGVELKGKTVAVLGYGRIGAKVARLFAAFGCRVLVWVRNPDGRSAEGITFTRDLEEALSKADIVSVHLPLNKSTERFIDKDKLKFFKQGSILVNTARGGLIDEDALLEALGRGAPRMAALDLLVEEDPNMNKDSASTRLVQSPNVLATPHIGFKTEEALERKATEAIRNVVRFAQGNRENALP